MSFLTRILIKCMRVTSYYKNLEKSDNMLLAIRGDITKIENVKYICSAANGIGPMGAGVAGAIKRAGGVSIEQEAFLVCSKTNYQPGDIYITKAGMLPYKEIFHLVTMKYPGSKTSYDVVEKCLKNLINLMRFKNIKKIALPALGTGIGGLDIVKVAEMYKRILKPIEDLEFIIIDIDPVFIYQFKS